MSRVPELVPIRYGRMLVSPFTFFRGAALIMAADLSGTPRTPGLNVQLCGDAHLSNFGVFASPERQLVFDINDFDETLPGPWEWDVKRLAASFEVAGRDLGFARADRRAIVMTAVREYRSVMREAAAMRTLDAWYAHMEVGQMLEWIKDEVREKRLGKKEAKEAAKDVAKARTRDSTRVHARLTGKVDGELRIVAESAAHRADRGPRRAGHRARGDRGVDAHAGRVLPAHAGAPASPARGVPLRPRGAQGGGRRQRRDPRLDPAARGARRPGPAVPAGEGGPGLGAGAVRRAQRVRPTTASASSRASA